MSHFSQGLVVIDPGQGRSVDLARRGRSLLYADRPTRSDWTELRGAAR